MVLVAHQARPQRTLDHVDMNPRDGALGRRLDWAGLTEGDDSHLKAKERANIRAVWRSVVPDSGNCNRS